MPRKQWKDVIDDGLDFTVDAGRAHLRDEHLDDFDDGRRVPPQGSPLPAFRPSPLMHRTRFAIELDDASTVTVDIDHASGRASLFRNDLHVHTSDMPARFRVSGGSIDVVAGKYGMQRIHLVRPDGSETRLEPSPGTPEHWRARLAQRHPRVGRALAVAAAIVLAIDLILLAPQFLEQVTHLPAWTDHFASFTSPVDLPAELNIALAITAALAGVERALTFRHHRLLDIETDGIER